MKLAGPHDEQGHQLRSGDEGIGQRLAACHGARRHDLAFDLREEHVSRRDRARIELREALEGSGVACVGEADGQVGRHGGSFLGLRNWLYYNDG